MSMNRGLHHISAQAYVPEHLLTYVAAVGGSEPFLFGDCVGHVSERRVVLVGYPPHEEPKNAAGNARVDAAVDAVIQAGIYTTITVLAPVRPRAAPAESSSVHDSFWMLPLPPAPPRQKLRNLLRRAQRELHVDQGSCWTPEHQSLALAYARSRPLESGTRHIFTHIGDYVRAGNSLPSMQEVVVFSAYAADKLVGCAVGDYSSLCTAFYMFAFRHPAAPPGTSDVLLEALCAEGLTRGHRRVNLGLGITPGIRFFKQKWQAQALLPYVETRWNLTKLRKSWWSRVFGHETTPPPQLDCLQVEVTSQCLGRCTYCPHTTQAAHWLSRAMKSATFAALYPLLRSTKRVHLQGWGEPLLHPHFFDFAALARKAGCQVSTTSCGLHMNTPLAEKLVDSGMDIVAFSLTGTDAVSNAARVGVPFERVRAAISTLQHVRAQRGAEHLEVHLAYLLLGDSPESVEAVRALPRLLQQWEIPVAVVSTLDYIAAPEQQAWAFAPHETVKIAHARQVLEDVRMQAARLGSVIHYSLPQPVARAQCRENIQRNLYVDADGLCAPCIYLNIPTTTPDPGRRTFGTVAEQPALDIWNAQDFAHFRKSLVEERPEGACRFCPKRFEACV
ncbi:MAG: radical SAM protein [Desulfovibrionaceae bacterium]